MSELARVGDFCPNPECEDYGKVEAQIIIKYGKARNGSQRYQCKTCGKTFNERKGTIFYQRKTPEKEILECLAWLAEGTRISSIQRVKGIKEETINSFLAEASEHAEAIEKCLMNDYQISQVQMDALWTYVGHKKKQASE